MRIVEIFEYNKQWEEIFKKEKSSITNILGEELIQVYHIGSTAIPNIRSKPVIDIMLEVRDVERLDTFNRAFEKLGYETMGEFGIKGRRFYQKGGNKRTHHIHAFEEESQEIERHILFRDYMLAFPEKAQEYSRLKTLLAKVNRNDPEAYNKGKTEFIKKIDYEAKLWAKNKRQYTLKRNKVIGGLEIIEATIQDKFILKNMLEFYLYDISPYKNLDLNSYGQFGYPYLDSYWKEGNRYPFLTKLHKKIIGFALVNNHHYIPDVNYAIAEFFVMKRYRREGIGKVMAFHIFDKFRGTWEIR